MSAVGQAIRDFTLPGVEGPVAWSSYRGRRNLVILFLAGEGRERWRRVLNELVAGYQEIEQENAQVIAVFPNQEQAAEASTPFPAAWDASGILTSHYARTAAGIEASALLVTDRFGEIYQHQVFDPAAPAPDLAAVLDTLQFIEKQCPECGAPVWPAD